MLCYDYDKWIEWISNVSPVFVCSNLKAKVEKSAAKSAESAHRHKYQFVMGVRAHAFCSQKSVTSFSHHFNPSLSLVVGAAPQTLCKHSSLGANHMIYIKGTAKNSPKPSSLSRHHQQRHSSLSSSFPAPKYKVMNVLAHN